MKAKLSKAVLMGCLLTVQLLDISTASAKSEGGSIAGGGGDSYVLDFIKTASKSVYPWLKKNESTLNRKIDLDAFIQATDPTQIYSTEKVYESCDGSTKGREVEACFNAKTNMIALSRSMYKVNDTTPAKLGVVAHEIFRKMGIEGDGYELSRKLTFTDTKAAGQNTEDLEKELKILKSKYALGNNDAYGFACGSGLYYSVATEAAEKRCVVIEEILQKSKKLKAEAIVNNAMETDEGNNNSEAALNKLLDSQEAVFPDRSFSSTERYVEFFPKDSPSLIVLKNKYGYRVVTKSRKESNKQGQLKWEAGHTTAELNTNCLPLIFSYDVNYRSYNGINPITGILFNVGIYEPKDYYTVYDVLCAPSKEIKSLKKVVKERFQL